MNGIFVVSVLILLGAWITLACFFASRALDELRDRDR